MKLPSIYPLVSSIFHPSALAEGPLDCQGATIHYTADRNVDRLVAEGVKSKIGYHLMIGRDGSVIQTCFLDKRVNHAGAATWHGLSPNRKHMAIALVSWGLLDVSHDGDLVSWTGDVVPIGEVRQGGSLLYPDVPMWWDAATPQQLKTLVEILRWAIALGAFTAQAVCGHDECAVPSGRKIDPGGVVEAAAVRKMVILNV